MPGAAGVALAVGRVGRGLLEQVLQGQPLLHGGEEEPGRGHRDGDPPGVCQVLQQAGLRHHARVCPGQADLHLRRQDDEDPVDSKEPEEEGEQDARDGG